MFEALAAFLGLSGKQSDIRDAAWAIRRLILATAAEAPVVLFVDDAHWADPTLLELAGRLAADEEPLLVVVLARPDIFRRRPARRRSRAPKAST